MSLAEVIRKKVRGFLSQFAQFFLGVGIALLVLGVVTGVLALGLLVFRKFF
jgi:hypothetical protein